MIFYSDKNVYEAAKDRIRWIFEEFKDRKIVVGFSGGKDSTVVLYLVKEVMDELGIKKIPLFFLDQELESPQVVDYVRYTMHLPWVEPYWVQSYFKEWNSSKGEWFNVWGNGEQWAREKEPDSLHDLVPDKINDFGKVLDSFQRLLFGDNYVCLGGLHIDESPSRRIGLLKDCCYKDVTWGQNSGRNYGKGNGLVLYPLFDWRVYDIWYYIFSNKIPYCKLYNYLFTKRPLLQCRVSSFIHENSIQDLKIIKEIAPQFYDAAIRRIENINTTVHVYDELEKYIETLPPYFKDWDEYVEYCAIHLTQERKNADRIIRSYKTEVTKWRSRFIGDDKLINEATVFVAKAVLVCILAEDYGMSKLQNKTIILAGKLKEYERRTKKNVRKGVEGVAESDTASE